MSAQSVLTRFLDAYEAGSASVGHERVSVHSRGLSRRALFNSFALALADACALLLAVVFAGSARVIMRGAPVIPAFVLWLIPLWWVGSWFAGLLPGWGLPVAEHLRRQILLVSALFSFGAFVMFFTRTPHAISRLSIGGAWLLASFFVPLLRMLVRNALCEGKLYGVPTVLVGKSSCVAEIVARLRLDSGLGYFPVGIYTDDESQEINGVPVLGKISNLGPTAPAAIVITDSLDLNDKRQITEQALSTYRNVLVVNEITEVSSLLVAHRNLSGIIGLEFSQVLFDPYATKIKRVVDLFLVTATAPLWLSVCSLITLLVYFEDYQDPIFKQARLGRGGKAFFAFKFRTMVVNAETALQEYLRSDPTIREEWETHCKLRNDPRITRVGKFLRKTSLDELPQLFNVLFGQMALVGPRPLPYYHHEQLSSVVQQARRQMRPGLTGLWQVSGRSDAGTVGMARWDPHYVRNWSIWLDIVILVRTLRVVLKGSGAR